MEKLLPKIAGYGKVKVRRKGRERKIFKAFPHSTWDNFFSGDRVMDWLGSKGFGATMTCRQDRLPSDVPGHYLHKKKTIVDDRTKMARFLPPIVLVKDVNDV